ncbi:hypothetical protein BKA93DRAFT_753353 [Sparassis latifolia]
MSGKICEDYIFAAIPRNEWTWRRIRQARRAALIRGHTSLRPLCSKPDPRAQDSILLGQNTDTATSVAISHRTLVPDAGKVSVAISSACSTPVANSGAHPGAAFNHVAILHLENYRFGGSRFQMLEAFGYSFWGFGMLSLENVDGTPDFIIVVKTQVERWLCTSESAACDRATEWIRPQTLMSEQANGCIRTQSSPH